MQNPHNLRQVSMFSTLTVKRVYPATDSMLNLGPKYVWDILPEKLKNIENIVHFKKEMKKWKPDNCS